VYDSGFGTSRRPNDVAKTNVGCSGRVSQSYRYPAMLKSWRAARRGRHGVEGTWNVWRAEDRDNIDSGTLMLILQGEIGASGCNLASGALRRTPVYGV
jgi:hypothetical protein